MHKVVVGRTLSRLYKVCMKYEKCVHVCLCVIVMAMMTMVTIFGWDDGCYYLVHKTVNNFIIKPFRHKENDSIHGIFWSQSIALFHSFKSKIQHSTNNWQSRSRAYKYIYEHICMFYIVWATVGRLDQCFIRFLYSYLSIVSVRFGLVVGAKMVLELLQNWQPESKSSPTPILTITLFLE